ncbi:hypothetical protein Tco_1214271 [Tanacetum coccineum]
MELEPEIKVPGFECNRSLPEGVPFINNMVIKELEYVIFFTDVFGDQAFQRWNDIHKVGVDSLVSHLVMASDVPLADIADDVAAMSAMTGRWDPPLTYGSGCPMTACHVAGFDTSDLQVYELYKRLSRSWPVLWNDILLNIVARGVELHCCEYCGCHELNSEGSESAWMAYMNARVDGLFLLVLLEYPNGKGVVRATSRGLDMALHWSGVGVAPLMSPRQDKTSEPLSYAGWMAGPYRVKDATRGRNDDPVTSGIRARLDRGGPKQNRSSCSPKKFLKVLAAQRWWECVLRMLKIQHDVV